MTETFEAALTVLSPGRRPTFSVVSFSSGAAGGK